MNDTPTKHKTKKIIIIITMILLLFIGGMIVVIREINHYVDTHMGNRPCYRGNPFGYR